MNDGPALAVENLEVAYRVRGIDRQVLRGVSFSVQPGEAYGLVGESGCGKSTTAYAALSYLPRNGRITAGRIVAGGRDLTRMDERELQLFRAGEASMVFQDPALALNPTLRIGRQLTECFTLLGRSKLDARREALDALTRVRIADPPSVLDRYPHQLSGGMQQRVVIAMALACQPKLLVLDEPTTGLDATVEAEVLDLIRVLRTESDAAILLIAHNLGIIRSVCDRVGVMYAGMVVEEGPSEQVFDDPQHPYTVGLLQCLPRHGVTKSDRPLATIAGSLPLIGTALSGCVYVERCPIATDVCRVELPPPVPVGVPGSGRFTRCHHADQIATIPAADTPGATAGSSATVGASAGGVGDPMLQLAKISKTFKQRGRLIPALVEIDLGVGEGETLGLVGESGSGKSTLAKTLLGIEPADAGGDVLLDGRPLERGAGRRSAGEKRVMQMVFQNPDSALNRAWTVRRILERSVRKLTGVSKTEAAARVVELATQLRLSERHLDLKPRQLSGGLKQRVAIARAFAGDPRIVVCDEPTSALDVSVQAAILNLLAELQTADRTSYVFISHDLGVVRYLADRIAVLYLGRVQEVGTAAQIFSGPHHPYTEALLSAVPSVDGEPGVRIRLDGEIPSPADPPSGCVFHPRCARAIEGLCAVTAPPMAEAEPGHFIRCHIPVDELRVLQRTGTVVDSLVLER